MKQDLNVYKCYRNYCNPSIVVVIAKSKKDAIELCNKTYGFTEVKAYICNKPSVVLSK
jgi:hypothetical protein